jgi:hypothetical protein
VPLLPVSETALTGDMHFKRLSGVTLIEKIKT